MPDARWMIYGAYGYTGELLATQAVARGHQPTLAGRSQEKLAPIAERLGLPHVVVGLDDAAALRKAVEGHRLVLHAAGPFVKTHRPMLRACLDAGAHYLDITGELDVFDSSFAHDAEAKARNVALISGVGFDVIPSDCLCRHVAEQVPDADDLVVVIKAIGSPSVGTVKSALGMIQKGGVVRRDGVMVPFPLGTGLRHFRFPQREYAALPVPWGDLVTAFHTTGIRNITTYMTFPPRQAKGLRFAAPALRGALRFSLLRRGIEALVDARVKGPTEELRRTERSHIYARAANARGQSAEAWLETTEGYQFTAVGALLAVEKTLSSGLRGAHTPARAFGKDFVLEVPGTRRIDRLG